jgi:tetratricopeptide (TPR) repeat protein
MRALHIIAVAFLASAAAVGDATDPPSFNKDIAPLLRARCVPCHQQDGDAPFPLVTYRDVRPRARLIAEVTAKRYMPPWKPAIDSPAFAGDRRLTDAEIASIDHWVKAGAPEGRAEDLTVRDATVGGWLWGEPDVVLTLPTYSLRADGPDVFRNFVVTVPGSNITYIRGFQLRPGNAAVHHANIRVDPTPASRAMDDADPEPGYEGMILRSADYPDGHFLGWTPGQAAPPSSDLAWELKGGTDLVFQLHMRPTGRVERIAPRLGLYVASTPSVRRPTIVRLGRQNLDIPPGASDYRTSDSLVLPVDAQVVSIQPHAHYRARDVAAFATLPDGTRRSLIHIADWDFGWQDLYRLEEPFWLPAGTKLEVAYSFDNSEGNPRNPSRPPERVKWGWRSSDEMGDVWIQVFTRNDRDRLILSRTARRKMAEEDAIGSEVLIEREPDHVNLQNDAALIYQELGRADRALAHFSVVTRLQPQSPAAHYNEGVALEALGREPDAAAQYADAVRLDPKYAPARFASANLLYRRRQVDAAIAEYRAALALNHGNSLARCSLARALTETRRPAEAVSEYETALHVEADSVPCLINYAWLLSAHSDASIRRPIEAVQLAERATALTFRDSADALDALAAAYASAGRFDDAVQVAMEGVRLAESTQADVLARDIRARVDLYKRHVTFTVRDP